MDKKIPIYFDTIILDSPIQEIPSDSLNGFRLKVGVFTKYKNRNYSYITPEFADALIASAIKGNIPVVGFFDPESQTWASHTGPTLANAYGYVESFLGWEPFTDTDGVTRDYAVFSVIIFTDYYEEAKKIRGQHQSMELNPESITGDWVDLEGEEYFVYKTGNMLGFCIIGAHEPCFSVSSFFSKNDEDYKSQYEKFSSLLSNLKTQVEEAENKQKGGEQCMDELQNQEVVEETVVEETPAVEFETVEEAAETVTEETVVEETIEEEVTTEEVVEETQPTEYELLQEQFNTLQNSYNELEQNYNAAQAAFEEERTNLNTEIANLRSTTEQLQASLQAYAFQQAEAEYNKKLSLIEKYENLLTEEEINPIKEMVKDFSYDELESKLAITFANKKITGAESKKVPLPEPEESQFALLMKKYKKH